MEALVERAEQVYGTFEITVSRRRSPRREEQPPELVPLLDRALEFGHRTGVGVTR
jgi:hypothetical protein